LQDPLRLRRSQLRETTHIHRWSRPALEPLPGGPGQHDAIPEDLLDRAKLAPSGHRPTRTPVPRWLRTLDASMPHSSGGAYQTNLKLSPDSPGPPQTDKESCQ